MEKQPSHPRVAAGKGFCIFKFKLQSHLETDGSFTAQEKEQAKCPVRSICVKIFSLKHKVLKKSVIYTKTWPTSLEQRQRVEKGNRSCLPVTQASPAAPFFLVLGRPPTHLWGQQAWTGTNKRGQQTSCSNNGVFIFIVNPPGPPSHPTPSPTSPPQPSCLPTFKIQT